MKPRLMLVALAFIGLGAFNAVAADCHSKISAPVIRASAPQRVMINILKIAPLTPELHITAATDENTCPHYARVREWVAWRLAHPKAHSRYPGGDRISVPQAIAQKMVRVSLTQVKLGFAMDDSDPAEMEPYMEAPSGDLGRLGGCGCPLEVALRTCGWIHSQIWY